MTNRLFVAGLPYEATEQELMDLFSKAGKVLTAKIIIDRATNRSKGFGFIDMETPEEAQTAIDTLNGDKSMGRTLIVKEATPKPDYQPRRSFDRDRRDR